jgi:ketosteroid isomerase-like protein
MSGSFSFLHCRARAFHRTCLGAAALLVPALLGCNMAPSPADDPIVVVLAQQAAWNRGDVIGFMAGYHRASDTTFSGADGTLQGWDEVLRRYQEKYPDRASMGKLSFSKLHARRLGSNAALVTGEWRLERANDAPGGVFSLVFERLEAGWRIIHDHTSLFAQGAKTASPANATATPP